MAFYIVLNSYGLNFFLQLAQKKNPTSNWIFLEDCIGQSVLPRIMPIATGFFLL